MRLFFYPFLFLLGVAIVPRAVQAQDLIDVTFIQSVSQSELPSEFQLFAENGIDLYKVLYTTADIEGRTDTASGLMVLPQRENVQVPMMVVQHGTVDGPDDVPSNVRGGWELAGVFGALGYAVIAPDMLGLGEARGFHPYVHAATESSAAIDMMFAMQQFDAESAEVTLNGQLFLTGYSQGGHAVQALHRDLQANYADQFPVTAATHLSGPYSISGVMYDLILSDDPYGTVAYAPYTLMSYNEVYGLYDNLEEYIKQPYAAMCEEFYRGELGLFDLNARLIDTLIAREGASITKFMLQDSIITAMTDNPNHPARIALADNDTYDWAPQVPTRIYYCEGDDQVPFRNSVLADSVMQANGASDLVSSDLSATADHRECIAPAVVSTIFFFGNYREITTSTDSRYQLPIQVWPNPARDYVQVQGVPANGQLRLIDLNGRVLQNWITQPGQMQLNLPDLNSGIYVLQLNSAQGYWSQKIMIR